MRSNRIDRKFGTLPVDLRLAAPIFVCLLSFPLVANSLMLSPSVNTGPTTKSTTTTTVTTPGENGKPPSISTTTVPTPASWLQGWGVGLAIMRNSTPVISSANLVNNVVRANSSQTWQPELLFAKNFFFHHSDKNSTCLWFDGGACPGIFLGVGIGGSGSSQAIDMVGGGFVIGFGANSTSSTVDQSNNFGIGIGRRFGVQTLGDGISADQPLPTGETQIRYTTKDISAPFLFYTYKFQ